MNLLHRRDIVTVTVTVSVGLALIALAGTYVVREHLWALETIEQIEPRYARLLGLRDAAPALEESLRQQREALAKLGYPADRDAAQLGNDLQQLARKAMQAAGVSVASSQVLTPRIEGGVERVLVSVQGEGPLSGVQVALAALQTERPRIAFDTVLLQATGRTAEDGTPIVSCRLTVAVLRLAA